MVKAHLFKPFPIFIHIIGWVVYFLWIGSVNVMRYGAGHVWVMLGVMPVMLGIFYLNWFLLRQFFLKGIKWKGLVISILYLLLLLLIGYQVLYGPPNQFAGRLLKSMDDPTFGFAVFFIEMAGFYWTFTYKGLGVAAAEILFNLTRARFAYVTERHNDPSEQRKRVLIRRWISHFLGNMTQSLVYMIKRGQRSVNRFESFAIIWASAARIMARENNFLIPLDDELRHLRRLEMIYPIRLLQMKISGHTQEIKIVPMILLALYKNMYKHGDFSGGAAAVFDIDCGPDRLVITTKNKIAVRSAWVYEKEGTGLDQLENILEEQYEGAANVVYKVENDIFFLQIEILFTYGRVQDNFATIQQTEETKGSGSGR